MLLKIKNSKKLVKTIIFFFVIIFFLPSIHRIIRNDENIINCDDSIINDKPNISQQILWGNNGTIICNTTGTQYDLNVVEDEMGGAIFIWVNQSGHIYAQRINATTGERLWGLKGIVICNVSIQSEEPQLVSDGTGGAIIVWYNMSRIGNEDIYAQRVDASGTKLWGANGTTICNATGNQYWPLVIKNGVDSAIIIWNDERGGMADIYAQKVSIITGAGLWGGNGTVICNAIDGQWDYQLVGDGIGGAIITWEDYRNGMAGMGDIYAQRVDATTGAGLWGPNGTLICNATGNQGIPQVIIDEEGDAVITWEDRRNLYVSGRDIYAQKVDVDSGAGIWEANGTVICNAYKDQRRPQLIGDGAGNSIITWADNRSGNLDIYALKVDTNGAGQWGINGTIVCSAIDTQWLPQIIGDGAGGAIIVWRDERNFIISGRDIYAQNINTNGVILWGSSGIVICNANNDQTMIITSFHP